MDKIMYFELIRILKKINTSSKIYKNMILTIRPPMLLFGVKSDKYEISLLRRSEHLDKNLLDWYDVASFSITESQLDLLLEILEIDMDTPIAYMEFGKDAFELKSSKTIPFFMNLKKTQLWYEYLQYEEIERKKDYAARKENLKKYDDLNGIW